MKTQKRRANPLRRAYDVIIKREHMQRPRCCLVHNIIVDHDGRLMVHFTCLVHDASWRYYLEVNVDATPDSGPYASSACPPHREVDAPLFQERPPPEAEETEPPGAVESEDDDGEV